MTIMIVDDSAPIRRMIRTLLEPTGAEFLEAADGLQAIEAYRGAPSDWVLMDIMMEPLNGIETLRRLKTIDQGVKVIMVSQYDNPELRSAAEEAGSAGYVSKKELPQLLGLITGTSSHKEPT